MRNFRKCRHIHPVFGGPYGYWCDKHLRGLLDNNDACPDFQPNEDAAERERMLGGARMIETVCLTLPLPPAILSPNRPPGPRGGRFARASASKRYKRLAYDAATAERIDSAPWGRATVQAAFFHKTARRRDDVNHLAMLKPAYDGLVEAGLLVDDDSEHLTTLPATFAIDRENPRVTLTVARVS